MFHASESDVEAENVPVRARLPAALHFLRQECTCERRSCFQQFKDVADQVQSKRDEFKNLPRHEKARVLTKTMDGNFMFVVVCMVGFKWGFVGVF